MEGKLEKAGRSIKLQHRSDAVKESGKGGSLGRKRLDCSVGEESLANGIRPVGEGRA